MSRPRNAGRYRAKAFDKAGFNLDHDHAVTDEIRFVQLTPPGSGCSIAIGKDYRPRERGWPSRS